MLLLPRAKEGRLPPSLVIVGPKGLWTTRSQPLLSTCTWSVQLWLVQCLISCPLVPHQLWLCELDEHVVHRVSNGADDDACSVLGAVDAQRASFVA